MFTPVVRGCCYHLKQRTKVMCVESKKAEFIEAKWSGGAGSWGEGINGVQTSSCKRNKF